MIPNIQSLTLSLLSPISIITYFMPHFFIEVTLSEKSLRQKLTILFVTEFRKKIGSIFDSNTPRIKVIELKLSSKGTHLISSGGSKFPG